MDTVTRVQFLDETICLSHCVNTLRKSINPTILPLQLSRGKTRLFNLGIATSQRNENSENKLNFALKLTLYHFTCYREIGLIKSFEINIYYYLFLGTLLSLMVTKIVQQIITRKFGIHLEFKVLALCHN